jgi:hypothetical protein
MKRNLKVFGLALVMAAALSAVVASAASAHFTFGADATTLTASATNNQVFFETTGTPGENAVVSCTAIGVTGGPFGTEESELTVHPIYGGTCTVNIEGLGNLTAEILTTGCNYIFTTSVTSENIHIECETGKQIELTAFILGKFRKCLDFHAQTPTVPVLHYYNQTDPATGKMDIEIESTVSGITYEKTGSCAFGTTEGNDARYTGNVTVTCDEEGTNNPVDCTKS